MTGSRSPLLEQGESLARDDRVDQAEPLFAPAAEIFEPLQGGRWLERVAVAARVGTPALSA